MSLFNRLFSRKDGRASVTITESRGGIENQVPLVPSMASEDEEELIAVLTAAVAACMGQSVERIRVRNVLRVPEGTPAWARAGLADQMSIRRSH